MKVEHLAAEIAAFSASLRVLECEVRSTHEGDLHEKITPLLCRFRSDADTLVKKWYKRLSGSDPPNYWR